MITLSRSLILILHGLGFLAFQTAQGLEPLTVQSLEKDSNAKQWSLSWSGGQAPFLVQESPDLIQWSDLGSTDKPAYAIDGAAAPQRYFRVKSAEAPVLGERIGEWRIAQGEFGEPLAKHRLKSIWEFFLPEDESVSTAKAFFTKATVRLRHLEGTEVQTFVGRLEDLPEASLTTEKSKIQFAWKWGEGEWERDLTLELTFRYGIDALRFDPVNLSDPTIKLSVDYSTPKPTQDRSGTMKMTSSEEASLVEVDDSGDAPGWWNRKIQFTKAGVTIDSSFRIGVPLLEGGPAFIFKTPLLVSWDQTTVTGLTSTPIVFTDRFSQTYFPFHHNFVETLWLEPALEPDIDPATLEELQEKNIRFIVPQNPSAFPNQKPTLHVLGFDNVLREL